MNATLMKKTPIWLPDTTTYVWQTMPVTSVTARFGDDNGQAVMMPTKILTHATIAVGVSSMQQPCLSSDISLLG